MPNRTFRRTDDGRKQTFILGLIGGVGAERARFLPFERSLRFYVIQTDLTARRLFGAGEAAFEEIAALLAGTFKASDGRIDRARLAEQIFKDPQNENR